MTRSESWRERRRFDAELSLNLRSLSQTLINSKPPARPKKEMPPKKLAAAKNKKEKEKQPPAPSTPVQLQWPLLEPLLPAADLELVEVLPDQIRTIPNFFTATLCKKYVNFLQKSVPLATTPGKPKRGDAVRVNDRFQIHDPAFADRLWNTSGLREVVAARRETTSDTLLWGGSEVVGLNPK